MLVINHTKNLLPNWYCWITVAQSLVVVVIISKFAAKKSKVRV